VFTHTSRYRPPILGVVTIGQSPRPDLERVFAAQAPDARIRVVGALDGLDSHEIADLSRRATDYPLLVRLLDGSTREIGIEWLHPLVERHAQELATEGARAVVVACAGDFPPCQCEVPVILPGRLVPQEAAERSARKQVGIVTPVERQARAAGAKWLADGFLPVVTWASPVKHSEIVRASDLMRDADVDVVVLDCMGHDAAYAEEFARRSGKPVFTAQEVAARDAARHLR
jgi:protein AroM